MDQEHAELRYQQGPALPTAVWPCAETLEARAVLSPPLAPPPSKARRARRSGAQKFHTPRLGSVWPPPSRSPACPCPRAPRAQRSEPVAAPLRPSQTAVPTLTSPAGGRTVTLRKQTQGLSDQCKPVTHRTCLPRGVPWLLPRHPATESPGQTSKTHLCVPARKSGHGLPAPRSPRLGSPEAPPQKPRSPAPEARKPRPGSRGGRVIFLSPLV